MQHIVRDNADRDTAPDYCDLPKLELAVSRQIFLVRKLCRRGVDRFRHHYLVRYEFKINVLVIFNYFPLFIGQIFLVLLLKLGSFSLEARADDGFKLTKALYLLILSFYLITAQS